MHNYKYIHNKDIHNYNDIQNKKDIHNKNVMHSNNIDNIKWKGFKQVKVFKIVQEDENVKSFYIKNEDDSKLPEFIAGQFIAVRVKNEDGTYTKPRQYTLSLNYNEDYYRISVKRESEGYLSKILCDTINEGDNIEISVPMGKFILKESEKPLVLLGGGIGITPMVTMAYDSLDAERDIHFIYSIPNSKNHSFREEIEDLTQNERINKKIFYTRPVESDVEGKDFDIKGRISKEWIKENLPLDGEFYFCGPVPFMKALYDNLVDLGVEKDRINYELFGPGADFNK